MSVVYSHALKYSQGELGRNPEMDSNIGDPQQNCHQYNSGLLRYRSAPSSMLTGLVDNIHGCVNEEAFRSEHQQGYLPSTSSEMETMLAKLISSNNVSSNSDPLQEFGGRSVKQEEGDMVSQGPQTQHNNGYSFGSQDQLIYQPQQIQGLQNGSLGAVNAYDGSFSAVNPMASENNTRTKMGSSNCSNLIRQKSSPAGFFSNYSVDNGMPFILLCNYHEISLLCMISSYGLI